eukprot:scaffold12982_cov129-Cylindrotheca_fusiformis.AAC.13
MQSRSHYYTADVNLELDSSLSSQRGRRRRVDAGESTQLTRLMDRQSTSADGVQAKRGGALGLCKRWSSVRGQAKWGWEATNGWKGWGYRIESNKTQIQFMASLICATENDETPVAQKPHSSISNR